MNLRNYAIIFTIKVSFTVIRTLNLPYYAEHKRINKYNPVPGYVIRTCQSYSFVECIYRRSISIKCNAINNSRVSCNIYGNQYTTSQSINILIDFKQPEYEQLEIVFFQILLLQHCRPFMSHRIVVSTDSVRQRHRYCAKRTYGIRKRQQYFGKRTEYVNGVRKW